MLIIFVTSTVHTAQDGVKIIIGTTASSIPVWMTANSPFLVTINLNLRFIYTFMSVQFADLLPVKLANLPFMLLHKEEPLKRLSIPLAVVKYNPKKFPSPWSTSSIKIEFINCEDDPAPSSDDFNLLWCFWWVASIAAVEEPNGSPQSSTKSTVMMGLFNPSIDVRCYGNLSRAAENQENLFFFDSIMNNEKDKQNSVPGCEYSAKCCGFCL